jgi:hypothetical protein
VGAAELRAKGIDPGSLPELPEEQLPSQPGQRGLFDEVL